MGEVQQSLPSPRVAGVTLEHDPTRFPGAHGPASDDWDPVADENPATAWPPGTSETSDAPAQDVGRSEAAGDVPSAQGSADDYARPLASSFSGAPQTHPPATLPAAPAVAGQPGGSFSERYRGTEWGGPAQPALALGPATVASRPRASTGIAIGAALLALAAVVAIAFAIMQGGSGGAQVPAGALRLPPGSPEPATAAPGTVTKAGVVAAFIKRVTTPNLGYHVEFSAAFTATAYQGYEVASMAGAMDIRGQDFSGTWRVNVITGQNAETAMVYLGKNGYIRPPEEGWNCAAARAPRPQVNAFSAFKTAKDVRYEGIVTRNGQRLHRLRATRPLQINPWVMQDPEWAKATVSSVVYDMFVNDDGLPILSTFTARIRVPDPDGVGKTELKIAADYRFRDIGRPAKITAPAGVCKNQTPA
jgi:hypothetical protein